METMKQAQGFELRGCPKLMDNLFLNIISLVTGYQSRLSSHLL